MHNTTNYTYSEHLDNNPNLNIERNIQQESIQHNNMNIKSQRNPKNEMNHRSNHSERRDYSDNYTRTQNGKVIGKPDRLIYS